MSPSMQAEPFVSAGFIAADFPDVEMAILPKERAKPRLSSTSASKAPKPVETGASSSGLVMQPVAAGGELFLFYENADPKSASNYGST